MMLQSVLTRFIILFTWLFDLALNLLTANPIRIFDLYFRCVVLLLLCSRNFFPPRFALGFQSDTPFSRRQNPPLPTCRHSHIDLIINHDSNLANVYPAIELLTPACLFVFFSVDSISPSVSQSFDSNFYLVFAFPSSRDQEYSWFLAVPASS